MTEKEEKEIKRSVGVFLMDENERVLLVRRSFTQSNPGVYQPSANGKLENNEDWFEALNREIKEELGQELAKTIDVLSFVLVDQESYTYEDKPVIGRSYLGFITQEQIKLVKLSEESDKVIFVSIKDLNRIKTTKEVKETGFNPDEEIVMFTDQFEALKKIFQRSYHSELKRV